MISLFCTVAALLLSSIHSFTPSSARMPAPRTSTTQLASTTETTEYDVVKVDLADGRDYPIYIGAGFSEEEGTELHSA